MNGLRTDAEVPVPFNEERKQHEELDQGGLRSGECGHAGRYWCLRRVTRFCRGGGVSAKDPSEVTIGISMPEQQLERWRQDGDNLKRQLESKGYKVLLQFADNKTDLQASQIQNMANQGADYVVIAAIDGTAVGPAAEAAKSNGAKVIAYDRLIMNTEACDYYSTFNITEVGRLQGQYIVKKVGLDSGRKVPFNIVLMTGAPSDNYAK